MKSQSQMFRDELYAATLELGGLVNAKLCALGVEPAAARKHSEQIRQDMAGAAMLYVYFDALRAVPIRAAARRAPAPGGNGRS